MAQPLASPYRWAVTPRIYGTELQLRCADGSLVSVKANSKQQLAVLMAFFGTAGHKSVPAMDDNVQACFELATQLLDWGVVEPRTDVVQRPFRVGIVGDSSLAEQLAGGLAAIPDIKAGLCQMSAIHEPFPHWVDLTSADVDLAVVATNRVETDRAITTALTRNGVLHLVVRVGHSVKIGPLVRPGQTPCLNCFDLSWAGKNANYVKVLLAETRQRSHPNSPVQQLVTDLVTQEVAGIVDTHCSQLIGQVFEYQNRFSPPLIYRRQSHPRCFCLNLSDQVDSAAAA